MADMEVTKVKGADPEASTSRACKRPCAGHRHTMVQSWKVTLLDSLRPTDIPAPSEKTWPVVVPFQYPSSIIVRIGPCLSGIVSCPRSKIPIELHYVVQ